jgi:hypothetical protein
MVTLISKNSLYIFGTVGHDNEKGGAHGIIKHSEVKGGEGKICTPSFTPPNFLYLKLLCDHSNELAQKSRHFQTQHSSVIKGFSNKYKLTVAIQFLLSYNTRAQTLLRTQSHCRRWKEHLGPEECPKLSLNSGISDIAAWRPSYAITVWFELV